MSRRREVELSAETRRLLAETYRAFEYNQGCGDSSAEWCCFGCAVADLSYYLDEQPELEREQAWAEYEEWVEALRRSRGWAP